MVPRRSGPVVLISAALLAVRCGTEGTNSSAPVSPAQTAVVPAPPGPTAPPFQGETVSGDRLSAIMAPGWDVRLERTGTDGSGAASTALLHAANFALPASRGTMGGEAVARMGDQDVFIALVESGPGSAGRALYAAQGLPRNLEPQAFSPDALERAMPGKAGVQRFFTEEGRPFTLYAVIGSYRDREALVPLVNRFLSGVTIRPAS